MKPNEILGMLYYGSRENEGIGYIVERIDIGEGIKSYATLTVIVDDIGFNEVWLNKSETRGILLLHIHSRSDWTHLQVGFKAVGTTPIDETTRYVRVRARAIFPDTRNGID